MQETSHSENRTVLVRKPLAHVPQRGRLSRKIYFILCETTHRVKCGIATNTGKRFSQIQTGSPTHLRLIAELDGDASREKAIHRRLTRSRVHGEWFHYDDHVHEVIIDEMTAHLKDRYHGLYVARTALRGRLPAPHFPIDPPDPPIFRAGSKN